jgi:hypothetical protein
VHYICHLHTHRASTGTSLITHMIKRFALLSVDAHVQFGVGLFNNCIICLLAGLYMTTCE